MLYLIQQEIFQILVLANHMEKKHIFEKVIVEETTSTNSDLLAWVKTHQVLLPRLLLARKQTAGRGTHGRCWLSFQGSLTFSLAVPVSGTAKNWVGVSLAVGRGLLQMFHVKHVPVLLKWPNDLILNGKKLAGILIEVAKDLSGQTVLVVGVGCNIMRLEIIMDTTEYGMAFLSDEMGQTQADEWIEPMTQAILSAIVEMKDAGLSPTRDSWDKISHCSHQSVWVSEGGNPAYQAKEIGIDHQGCLIVKTEEGLRTLISARIRQRNE